MPNRWSNPNGYRHALAISLPLVASMGSATIMQFTDRIFLANYSTDAIAAALPAGLLSFTFVSFFLGVATYANAFIAQYTGAKNNDKIGASLWQGIYFSIISAVIMAFLYFLSEPMFVLIGHSSEIRALEIVYFKIITLGAGLNVLGGTLSCFYTGRGLTWTVMLVNLVGAIINIPLDYCLINGIGPFPELGIAGAAIASVFAVFIIVAIFGILILTPSNRANFGTWRNRAFDKKLFRRLMHYGLPSGVQFFLEILGFTFFIQMVGRLGDLELAATNIIFSIEILIFLPMIGFNIGTATLVGHAIGSGRPEDGVYATTSMFHISMTYFIIVCIILISFPETLIGLFESGNQVSGSYAGIMDMGITLIKFLLVFLFFDILNIIYSGAIKGAGDTKFIMWTFGALCFGIMIIPVYIAVEFLNADIYTLWTIMTVYICGIGIAFLLRYRQGKWKKMNLFG